MKYSLHQTVEPFLDKVRSHTQLYMTRVLGKEIIVFPNVMSPKYDWSSRFVIEHMPDQRNKDFLEIGSGTGIISVFAGLQGANITAVDINPAAVSNTRENMKKYGLQGEVYKSNLFDKVTGGYDTVLFNAPYHGATPEDALEMSVTDADYQTLGRFLDAVGSYLNPGGEVLLGFSDTGDVDLLHREIIRNHFYVKERIEKDSGEGWKAYLYRLKHISLRNKWQRFIYEDDYALYEDLSPYLLTGSILKVGYGFGFFSYFAFLWNSDITNVDVLVSRDALSPDLVQQYQGDLLPYEDNSFDVVVCNYTLHHSDNPDTLFRELVRVSKKRIIVVEEFYNSFFQKLDLVWNCWQVNRKAGQQVKIRWDCYLSEDRFREFISRYGLKIQKQSMESRRSFKLGVFVLEKT